MKMKTAEEIAAFLQPIAASCGAEIYEVVFKQGKNPSLTVFIDSDKEGGVDLDLCEAVQLNFQHLPSYPPVVKLPLKAIQYHLLYG